MIVIDACKFSTEAHNKLDFDGFFIKAYTDSGKTHVEVREVDVEPEVCGWVDADYSTEGIRKMFDTEIDEEDLKEFEEEFISSMSKMANLLNLDTFLIDNVQYEYWY